MKKPAPLLALVMICILGVLGYSWTISQRPPKTNIATQDYEILESENGKSPEPTAIPTVTTESTEASAPRYVNYSKTIFDQSAGKRRVLFFFAVWCPTCSAANKDFTENLSKIPGDVVLIRTNYNDQNTDQEEKALAKKYGITYQHTFVQIDSQGAAIAKWNGGETDELVANIK